MHFDETELTLRDHHGTAVRATLFAHSSPSEVVLVAGAMAVPRGYYARFARFLAERGAVVLTVDYAGVGGSRPASWRGFDATMTDWLADLDAGLRWLVARHPDARLTVVAHSLGGQVLPLLAEAPSIDRVVAVGTQFAHPTLWPGRERWRYEAIFRVAIPGTARLFGYLPGWAGLGADVPRSAVTEWARWCTSDRYLLDHVPEAAARFVTFDAEVLALAITDDDYAPRAGVEAWARHVPNVSVEVVAPADLGLEHLGHFGAFKPDARALWERLADVILPAVREAA